MPSRIATGNDRIRPRPARLGARMRQIRGTRWLAPGLAILGGLALIAALAVFQGSRGAGYDFRAYDDAARRLASGLPLYAPDTQSGPFSPGPGGLYLYPPPLAVLLLALVPLTTAAAAAAWQGLHLVAVAAACALFPVSGRIRLAAFGIASLSLPTLLDLNLGNVSTFVLLAAAAAWRWREGWIGSVSIALSLAVRPQMGLVLAWWAVRRRWLVLGAALLAGVALMVLTVPAVGIDGWQSYVRLLVNLRGAGASSSDVGFAALAQRAGANDVLSTAAFGLGALVALAAAAVVTRRDAEAGLVSTITATLLVVPLLWPHYLVLLLLPAAFLAARGMPWALAIPLLGWLPDVALPWVALAGCVAPALATVGGGAAGRARGEVERRAVGAR